MINLAEHISQKRSLFSFFYADPFNSLTYALASKASFFCVWKSVVKLVWLARWGYLSLHCPLKKRKKKRKLPDFPKEVCWCYYCRYYFFSFNFYLTAAKPEPLVFVARGMRSPRIEMLGGAGTDFFSFESSKKGNTCLSNLCLQIAFPWILKFNKLNFPFPIAKIKQITVIFEQPLL